MQCEVIDFANKPKTFKRKNWQECVALYGAKLTLSWSNSRRHCDMSTIKTIRTKVCFVLPVLPKPPLMVVSWVWMTTHMTTHILDFLYKVWALFFQILSSFFFFNRRPLRLLICNKLNRLTLHISVTGIPCFIALYHIVFCRHCFL